VDARVIDTGLPLHIVEVASRPAAEVASRPAAEAPSRPAAEAPAETFLLLHGYAASSFTWRHWTEALAKRGRVLLVDMKGFGEAPKPDDDRYGPLDFGDLLVQLIEALDLEQVTLIGHSLGGGVALLAAITLLERPPKRLSRLVLVASVAYRQPLPPFVTLARWPLLSTVALRMVGARRVIRAALRQIVYRSDAVTEDQVNAYAEPLTKPDGVRAALAAGRVIVPPSVDELPAQIARLDLPALLIWGDTDRVVPLWVGQRLARDLPNARLEVIPECGHVPPEEHPGRSLQLVEAFLDEHPL